MVQTKSRRSRIRKIAATAAAATTAAAVMAVPTAAHAEPVLNVDYPVTGTTNIAATGSQIALGPGTLHSTLDLGTGALSANLEMPPATSTFNAIGFLPVTVTTTLIEEGPTTGTIDLNTGAVTSTSRVTLKLSNMKVAGIPALVGSHCKTKTPATITLRSGADWDVLNGGTLSGTYTIPDFENCLLMTPMINLLVPGDGNTISLKLGAATVPPAVAGQLSKIG